jgi:hypothetical protein
MFRFIAPFLFLAPAFAAEPAKRIPAPPPPEGFPKFEVEEIDTGLKIGYAVIVVDIDGDKKPDIVVVDQLQIVWYQNPTWKKRVILDGKTKPDNVCITAMDIDGDGLPEFVVGAGWKPSDTKTPGTLQWLKRGKTLDEEWSMHAIPCDEPTVHRIQVVRTRNAGEPELILAPLMGRDSTKENNWMDGRPVRILSYPIPKKDPEKPGSWKPTVISEELHVVHNFCVTPQKAGDALVFACYEGVRKKSPYAESAKMVIGEGDQSTPKSNRGSSEIAHGRGKDADGITKFWYAAVEPWHGNKCAIYTSKVVNREESYDRAVIDEQLRWGHAVKFSQLLPDESDFLIAGVRDNPTKDDKFTEKRGVRLYRNDPKTKKWERYILEDGGVAVEDLTVADLDGDGKPDIIAVGRATGDARIYWNKGK